MRLYLFGDEAGDLVAQELVLGGFVDGGGHGLGLKVNQLFLQLNALGKDPPYIESVEDNFSLRLPDYI